MPRLFQWLLLLSAGLLSGCTASSFGGSSSATDLDVLLIQANREEIQEALRQTPRGSQVHLVDKADRRYIGVLKSANADKVELLSCICKEAVPGPDGHELQCKTSYVHFETLDTASLTHFQQLSPPLSADALQNLAEEGSEMVIDELVFVSGRRQRWGKPPEAEDSALQTAAEGE